MWVEKGWFNDLKEGEVVKTESDFCQLCFVIRQQPGAEYMKESYVNWKMREKSAGDYVGYFGSVYSVSLKHCGLKQITLDLSTFSDSTWYNGGKLKFNIVDPQTK